jgi:hypothetical protein
MEKISQEILEKLYSIQHTDNEIRFLNMYQGLPISHAGQILEIQENEVRIHVSKFQGLCFQLELSTIMMHDLLPQKIKAIPLKVDLRKEEVILGSLKYFSTAIEIRQNIRVETNKPVRGVLENCIETDVKITEISITGVGLALHRRAYNSKYFGKGKTVRIIFALPLGAEGYSHSLVVEGIVRNIEPMSNDFYFRLGIETFPRPSAEAYIEKYICIRQEEIFIEINRLCDLNLSSLFID